jgi:hypothetical protein
VTVSQSESEERRKKVTEEDVDRFVARLDEWRAQLPPDEQLLLSLMVERSMRAPAREAVPPALQRELSAIRGREQAARAAYLAREPLLVSEFVAGFLKWFISGRDLRLGIDVSQPWAQDASPDGGSKWGQSSPKPDPGPWEQQAPPAPPEELGIVEIDEG